MEVKFREARNICKFTQLHGAMQIPAKIVDHAINSLGIFAVGVGLYAGHGLTLCHTDTLIGPMYSASKSLTLSSRPSVVLRPAA